MIRFYHGCPRLADARRILKEGLCQVARTADSLTGNFAPLAARVYLTRRPESAADYATAKRREDWKEPVIQDTHGVIFALDLDPAHPMVWPDEDDLGDAVAVALRERGLDARLGDMPRPEPFSLIEYGNEDLIAALAADRDLLEEIAEAAEPELPPGVIDQIDEMDIENVDQLLINEIGKWVLSGDFPDHLRRRLLELGAAASVPEPAAVTQGYLIDRTMLPGALDRVEDLPAWP